MKSIDELIEELCPDGVEYKPLGKVCEIGKGEQLNRDSLLEQGPYPVVNGGMEPSGYWDECNFTANSITISQGGASAGYVNWISSDFWAGAHCFVIVKCETSSYYRYVYHVLKYYEYGLMKSQVGAGIPSVSKEKLSQLPIPLPHIAVQKEIVRILDGFMGLIDELEAELAARRKQYEQYMEKLLTFGDDVERKSLRNIGTSFVRGYGIKRNEVVVDGVPCVRYGEIYTTYNVGFDTCVSHTTMEVANKAKSFEHGDILFAITGEKIEDIAKCVAYLGHDKCYAGGDIVIMKHNQNPKYLSYALSTIEARRQKSKGKTKSKVVHSSVPALKSLIVPLPSLPEQRRIVEILDKFDALCNDETAGLVAEIAARKKQYEYYRDRLLTFKRKESA